MVAVEIRASHKGPHIIDPDHSPVLVGPSVSEVLLPHVAETGPHAARLGHKVSIHVSGATPVLILSNLRVRVGTIGGYSQRTAELVSADPVVWQLS
jgi:hypothetical protein